MIDTPQPYDPARHYWLIDERPGEAYSAAAEAFVSTDAPAFTAWMAAGNVPSRVSTIAELVEVLVRSCVKPAAELGGRWPVMTYTVVRRLEEAGKSSLALSALDSNPVARIRFLTAQWIWSDDPTATAMIAAIGEDPALVLAFDPNWRPS